jgi:hypothetical protein
MVLPSRTRRSDHEAQEIRHRLAACIDLGRRCSAQYEWLGADARKALMEFIDDCKKDNHARIDVFAYDLDEPDVIAALCQFGREKRLRAVLDNAPLHTAAGAVEPKVARLIRTAAGAENVKQGHFSRFQPTSSFATVACSRKSRCR